MRALVAVLALCVLGLVGGACAQATGQLRIEALPVVHVRQGEVQGCGVRLTGGEPNPAGSSWFDVSFNLFRRGFGVAQSIAYEMKRSGYEGESRPARVPVQSTWLRAGDEGSARLGENTERRESLVYRLVIDDVLALFEAGAGPPRHARHPAMGAARRRRLHRHPHPDRRLPAADYCLPRRARIRVRYLRDAKRCICERLGTGLAVLSSVPAVN